MSESLGIRIVGLDSGEYIIGIVRKTLDGELQITAPLLIQSETEEEESKIVIKSYNDLSTKEVIISSLKWIDLLEPSQELIKKYVSLNEALNIMNEAKSVDMEEHIPKKVPTSRKKAKKKRPISERWLDTV